MLCLNGIDYDECENEREPGLEHCQQCEDIRIDQYLEESNSQDGILSLREQQVLAKNY